MRIPEAIEQLRDLSRRMKEADYTIEAEGIDTAISLLESSPLLPQQGGEQTDTGKKYNIKKARRIAISNKYFKTHENLSLPPNHNLFDAGFNLGYDAAVLPQVGEAKPTTNEDFLVAFNRLCADMSAVSALLGIDGYSGIDPVLRAITDLHLKATPALGEVKAVARLYVENGHWEFTGIDESITKALPDGDHLMFLAAPVAEALPVAAELVKNKQDAARYRYIKSQMETGAVRTMLPLQRSIYWVGSYVDCDDVKHADEAIDAAMQGEKA